MNLKLPVWPAQISFLSSCGIFLSLYFLFPLPFFPSLLACWTTCGLLCTLLRLLTSRPQSSSGPWLWTHSPKQPFHALGRVFAALSKTWPTTGPSVYTAKHEACTQSPRQQSSINTKFQFSTFQPSFSRVTISHDSKHYTHYSINPLHYTSVFHSLKMHKKALIY